MGASTLFAQSEKFIFPLTLIKIKEAGSDFTPLSHSVAWRKIRMAQWLGGHAIELSFLEPFRFRQAHALLEAAGVVLAIDEWVAYANSLYHRGVGGEAGIVTVATDEGYIYGLFTFTVTNYGSRRLSCDFFVTGGLPGDLVTKKMTDALDSIARQNRCKEISVTIPIRAHATEPGKELLATLSEGKYRAGGVLFLKRLHNVAEE
jgi:hypothetical protein